jgi:histidinol phosphatase-like enzyme
MTLTLEDTERSRLLDHLYMLIVASKHQGLIEAAFSEQDTQMITLDFTNQLKEIYHQIIDSERPIFLKELHQSKISEDRQRKFSYNMIV